MDDNSKLPKQAKPQEFELVELLFQEYIQHNIASPNIRVLSKLRFQIKIRNANLSNIYQKMCYLG